MLKYQPELLLCQALCKVIYTYSYIILIPFIALGSRKECYLNLPSKKLRLKEVQ
jgi:hypothetical protein